MAQKVRLFVPVSMSVLLHVALFASMFVAFDWARPSPITPMAIQATLVVDDNRVPPPPVVEKKPEPEPEPVVVEPEPEPEPEPDNSEELRRAEEEKKRVQDALIEKERLEKIRQQEEADRKRKAEEEAQRKKDEEARKERERQEAERKRQEDIQRQREENERELRELEAQARQEEIDAEDQRLAAVDSGQQAVYIAMIRQKVQRSLSLPASAPDDLLCTVRVRQTRNGDVLGVSFLDCNGDEAVKRSIEAALMKSSPLPLPQEASLFDPNLKFPIRKQQ